LILTTNFNNKLLHGARLLGHPVEAFRHLIMSQQGQRKTKRYLTKKRQFSCVFYAHSQFLCSLARFDLANRGVRQIVQLHTFYARLLVFHETSAQPDFAVANCFDLVMSVFYSSVLTPSLIFLRLWTAVS